MLEFLKLNAGTIATAVVVLLIIAAAFIKIQKDKKQGKSGCGCGCSGCPSQGICHGGNKNNEDK